MQDNFFKFYRITYKNNENIKELYNIKKIMYDSFLKAIYPCEIYNYIAYFFSLDSIKDSIKNDNIIYYTIKENNDIIGYFEYKIINEFILLNDIYIIENKRNQKYSTKIINFLTDELKKLKLSKIKTYIYNGNKQAKNIFKKWNFKSIDDSVKYIGSDIYLYEEIFEYNL